MPSLSNAVSCNFDRKIRAREINCDSRDNRKTEYLFEKFSHSILVWKW